MTNKSIPLDGLKGSHPMGFMAALGLLRCLSEKPDFGTPRLHWDEQRDWVAVLSTEQLVSKDSLIHFLIEWTAPRSASPEFNWAEKINVEPRRFTTKAKEVLAETSPTNRSVADFFAAFCCELITLEGKLRPTAFDMTGGNQRFLKSLLELAGSLTPKKRDCFESFNEALFEQWRYEDDQHSLGWDPSTESLYALRANDPSVDKNRKNCSVRAAVYLAAEALPLFPCAPVGSRLATRGLTRVIRNAEKSSKEVSFFSWPIWCEPLCLEEVRSLIALKALSLEHPHLKELRAMGVMEVFRSQKVRTGSAKSGYNIFSTAYPCTEVKE